MNRAEAYGILARQLEQYRSLGYDALLELVGEPVSSEIVRANNEDVVVKVAVGWHD